MKSRDYQVHLYILGACVVLGLFFFLRPEGTPSDRLSETLGRLGLARDGLPAAAAKQEYEAALRELWGLAWNDRLNRSLVKAREAKDPWVARGAILVLGWGTREAGPKFEAILDDPDPVARRTAMSAMAGQQNLARAALPKLEAVVLSPDSTAEERDLALRACSWSAVSSEAIQEHLVARILATDRPEEDRVPATWHLVDVTEDQRKRLVDAAKADDARTRELALGALARLRVPVGDEVLDLFTEQIGRSTGQTAVVLAGRLADSGRRDERTQIALRDALLEPGHTQDARRALAAALESTGLSPDLVTPAFRELTDDPDPNIRISVGRVLR